MNEIPEKVDFFDKLPDYDIALYTHKKSKTNAEISLEMLQTILPRFEALEPWEPEGIKAVMTDLARELEVKNAKIMWPSVSPSPVRPSPPAAPWRSLTSWARKNPSPG